MRAVNVLTVRRRVEHLHCNSQDEIKEQRQVHLKCQEGLREKPYGRLAIRSYTVIFFFLLFMVSVTKTNV